MKAAPKFDASRETVRSVEIDWREPAQAIGRKVRAFNPVPGAVTSHGGPALKIWRALPAAGTEAVPGTVLSVRGEAIRVACGDSTVLEVIELQRAGGKRLSAAAFRSGCAIEPGERLGG